MYPSFYSNWKELLKYVNTGIKNRITASHKLAIDTQAYCYVFKNGSQILESTTGTVKPNATCTAHMTGSVIVDLAVSDYIELYIYQNSQ